MAEHQHDQRADTESGDRKATLLAGWNATGAGYQEMALGFLPAAERVLDLVPVEPGIRILDVATGTGIAALAAAQRGAFVTGVDFAPDLVAEAARLAGEAGLDDLVRFEVGDAEQLPYASASFDAVVSTFGAMFAPDHEAVAREIARVLKPGGVLAMTTWIPVDPNLCLMTITAPYLPPLPEGATSPLSWGRRDYAEALLSPYFTQIEITEGNVPLLAVSPMDGVDLIFRRALGPTVYQYRQFDHKTKLRARADAMALMNRCLTPEGTVKLDREYLLVRAVRS